MMILLKKEKKMKEIIGVIFLDLINMMQEELIKFVSKQETVRSNNK